MNLAKETQIYVEANSRWHTRIRQSSEMGILTTMAPETRGLLTDLLQLETPWIHEREVREVDPDILEKVAQLIPKGEWPPMFNPVKFCLNRKALIKNVM